MSNKYPGYCIECSCRVPAGHGNLVRSASGAWVVDCRDHKWPRKKTTAPKRPEPPRKAGDLAGQKLMQKITRAMRDASQHINQVLRYKNDYVYVQGAATWYESDEMNEDAGDMMGGGWRVTLYCRPATDEEAAPRKAADELAAQRKAAMDRVREITRTLLAYDAPTRRSEQEANDFTFDLANDSACWNWDRREGTIGGVLVLQGDEVAAWDSGYYDDYQRSLAITTDAALAAEIGELRKILA